MLSCAPALALSSQLLCSISQLAGKTLLYTVGTSFGSLTPKMAVHTVMLAELRGDGEVEMSMAVLPAGWQHFSLPTSRGGFHCNSSRCKE